VLKPEDNRNKIYELAFTACREQAEQTVYQTLTAKPGGSGNRFRVNQNPFKFLVTINRKDCSKQRDCRTDGILPLVF